MSGKPKEVELANGYRLKLSDLVKQDSTFTLKKNGKVYRLRKVNIRDEAWLEDRGLLDISGLIDTQQLTKVFMVVYHQLVEKDDFPPVMRREHDDNGSPVERLVPGHEVLMEALDENSATSECEEIFSAVLEVFGWSRPLREQIRKHVEDQELKKKSLPTGE